MCGAIAGFGGLNGVAVVSRFWYLTKSTAGVGPNQDAASEQSALSNVRFPLLFARFCMKQCACCPYQTPTKHAPLYPPKATNNAGGGWRDGWRGKWPSLKKTQTAGSVARSRYSIWAKVRAGCLTRTAAKSCIECDTLVVLQLGRV